MIKEILPFVAALCVLSSAVQAGGPTVVAADPVPAAPPAPAPGTDWSGAYAGLSYGRTSGAMDMEGFGLFDYTDGHATGIFLGYNLQRGQLVFGGELSYATVSGMVFADPDLLGDDTVDTLLELRGRIGYSLGNALLYGAVGLVQGGYTLNASETPTASGTSLALGMDYRMTDRIFLGLDYTRRTMEGTNESPPFDFDAPLDTVSLRLGLSF